MQGGIAAAAGAPAFPGTQHQRLAMCGKVAVQQAPQCRTAVGLQAGGGCRRQPLQARQQLPVRIRAAREEVSQIVPAAADMGAVGTGRRRHPAVAGVEQDTAQKQPAGEMGGVDMQRAQQWLRRRLPRQLQLPLQQVGKLDIEPVATVRPQPLRPVAGGRAARDGGRPAGGGGRAEVEFHCGLGVNRGRATAAAEQKVEFSQGLAAPAHLQVLRAQYQPVALAAQRRAEEKRYQVFKVDTEPPAGPVPQVLQQRLRVGIEALQPLPVTLAGGAPVECDRLSAGQVLHQWRAEQTPGEISDRRLLQRIPNRQQLYSPGWWDFMRSLPAGPPVVPILAFAAIMRGRVATADSTMAEFTRIGLIGRLGSDTAVYSLKRLIHFLQKQGNEVILEEETARVLPDHAMPTVSNEGLGKRCDLVIVVGGDGSLLGAARMLAKFNVPLLGVNRGRLGFLTDITPEEIEVKVGEVLAGKYMMESRFLLDMTVIRKGQLIGGGEALNDVVVHPGKFIRMIEFELYIDGQFVYSQRSDGMIVSTPTGSTAYALSGGGPIMHPKLDAIVMVPMYPHTLSSRPIVVDGNSEIKLLIGEQNSAYPHVTCDGQTHVVTEPGDEVHMHKKPHKLHLIHPLNHNFYETCRNKLGWGSHLVK